VFEDFNELDEKIKKQAKVQLVRGNVLRKRFDFTMESNIERVLHLYGSLLESGESCRG